MKLPAAFTRAENALRAHAMKYPETIEEFPWGHRAIKIKGKAFVFIAIDSDEFRMSVKLPGSNLAALAFPFASPTAYGMGRSGWVTASFGVKDPIPLGLLESWIDESFRAIAPKSFLKRMAQAGGSPPAKKTLRSTAAGTSAKPAPARGRRKS